MRRCNDGASGAPHFIARNVRASVINAGDGQHEHPTQGLLDMFTMRRKLGTLEGIRVAIIGDLAHSRVARSNIWGLTKLGAHVAVCGPKTLLPPGIEELGVQVFHRVEAAIEWADVLNDVLLHCTTVAETPLHLVVCPLTSWPPSTTISCPVMKSLSSEARKTMTPNKSSGTPTLLMHW